MSAAREILDELSRRGVSAQADGETIRLKPRALLDDALLARVKAHKPALLVALSGRRPATCSPTCYEVDTGCWIHHPWDGCQTCLEPLPEKLPEKAQAACWHCAGTGECNCITCGHLESHAEWKAGPCVPCKVRKQAQFQG
jgi:hypothetical protein